MKPLLSALFLLSMAAAAQDPGRAAGSGQQRRDRGPEGSTASAIRGPRIGFVFDAQRQALRPVLGLPGAAHVGEPVDLGAPLRQAAIAPGRDLALGIAADGRLLLVRLSGDPSASELKAPRFPQLAVFSPRGGVAAVLYRERVEVWDLQTRAQRGAEADLSAVPGAIGALAVSDDGQSILLAGEGGVYSWNAADGLRLAGNLGRASAIAFAPGTRDAFIADQEQDRIYSLREGRFGVFAGAAEGLAAPGALHVDSGGALLVANARDGSLVVLAPDKPPERIACDCAAAVFGAGGETGQVLVGSSPLRLLDPSGGALRVWFVPDALGEIQ